MAADEETDGDRIVENGPSGPLRLCAVTRASLPAADLIRFVAGPGGDLVPDPGARLPGRGVWITASRETLASAIKANSFARSLKRQVKIPGDLEGQVERLLAGRAAQGLAMVNKAGLAVSGFQQVDALIESGDAAILVHGADGATGGRDKLDRKYAAHRREMGVEARISAGLTIQQISLAMGRANVVHAALKPGGVSDKFWGEARRLERFRSGTRPATDI